MKKTSSDQRFAALSNVFQTVGLLALLLACSSAVVAQPPNHQAIIDATNALSAKVDGLPQVFVVAKKFTTHENAQTAFNLDGAVEPSPLPMTKLKRYTVSFIAPPALLNFSGNSIKLYTGVLQMDPLLTSDVTVFSGDGPGESGAAVGPYVGSNSFLSVVRGNDGLGDVDVTVNAYIEMVP